MKRRRVRRHLPATAPRFGPPAAVIRLQFEARQPIVYSDARTEDEYLRLEAWLASCPELDDLVERAVALAAQPSQPFSLDEGSERASGCCNSAEARPGGEPVALTASARPSVAIPLDLVIALERAGLLERNREGWRLAQTVIERAA